ncbi:DEKNAAC101486 [Brettanomyces naardenensis]|uniref:DEKNAAC101486 n=1 Tax=Brettanomyces naardenensis TaxID=13370 RepID=A0A448YHZ5_BRENA|nr:DEKNAAC101486 [Brettanomyces naardenensis]
MGLRQDQVYADEPENGRTKRVRLSRDRYRFVEQPDIPRQGSRILAHPAGQANEGGEHNDEEFSSPVSSVSSTSSPYLSTRVPSMVESLNILRERLNVIRQRQRRMYPVADTARSRPMRRHRVNDIIGDSLADSILRRRRAAGRLMRTPSLNFGSPNDTRERNANEMTDGNDYLGMSDEDIYQNERRPSMRQRNSPPLWIERANGSSVVGPMRHDNPQFVVNDSEWMEGDYELEDIPWNDTRSDTPESIQRRREIIQELGLRLRETRRRIFGNQDEGYNHDAFLREFGSLDRKAETWKGKEECLDVGNIGEDCFKLTETKWRMLAEASKEKYGKVMAAGVIFKEDAKERPKDRGEDDK